MNESDGKRESERIAFNQRVKYGPGEDANTDAVSVNLSASGIALKSYKALPPGSKISVVLYSGEKPVRLQGEVIWNTADDSGNETEMGIKIVSRKDEIGNLYKTNLARIAR